MDDYGLIALAAWLVVGVVCGGACMVMKQNFFWGLLLGPCGVVIAAVLHAVGRVEDALARQSFALRKAAGSRTD